MTDKPIPVSFGGIVSDNKEGIKAEEIEKSGIIEDSAINFPTFQVVLIVISFLLGLLDMMFLYRAIHNLTGLGNGVSMFTALIIAEVANFSILQSGKTCGDYMDEKMINKHTAGTFFAWVFLGIIYTVIRVADFISTMGSEDFNLYGEILQLFILAISFIGTGVTIFGAARIIWNRDASRCRKSRKKFDMIHEEMNSNFAELQNNYSDIINYKTNYKNLDIQKTKIEQSIKQSEDATLSDIVGKVLQNHLEVSSKNAYAVKDEILERRQQESK